MKIRITRGIYGFQKDGNVVEKTNKDQPFEVDDDEGKRLIALHVAESVSGADEDSNVSESEETEKKMMMSGEGHLTREDLVSMSKEDLSRLAEEFGIKKTGSKKDLVEQLLQCTVEYDAEEAMDEDEVPDLNAEEPD